MKHARHAAIPLVIAGIALAGCTTTHTARPAPHGSTSRPSPSQTSANPASRAWCSSAAKGLNNTLVDGFDLFNNEWNTPGHPGPQTTCGNSPSDWQVTSTQRAGNTAVLTYPSVQLNYNRAHGYPLSKFTSMTSSYAESMHAVSGTDAEAAYDIWLNGLKKEVMVWVDNHGQTPAGSKVATTTFSGAAWDLHANQGGYTFVRHGNATSGTVDLFAALKYLERRGDLAPSDVLWQVNFGWEIASTAGKPETFTVSNYSLTSAPTSWAWCSSAPFAESSPTPYDGPFDLFNNEWNTSWHPGPQTICGNSPSDWQVTSTQRAGNTAILSFPSVQLNYNGARGYPLSKFTSMTSSYAEKTPCVSGTDAQAAYDILLRHPMEEVMVWVDNCRQTPSGAPVATRKFSGATWRLYETHAGYMAYIRQGNATSGTIDLLAALKYLEHRGDLPASDVLWQVNFGWEIGSTAGAPGIFRVSNYSLSSTPSS